MKWTSYIAMLNAAMLISACGSLTTTTKAAFKVRMQGTYTIPTGASGTAAPQSEVYILKSVLLTQTDGTVTTLTSTDPTSYRIIDRPQIVYINDDMSAYDGIAFTKASVVFDSAVVVTTKQNAKVDLSLATATLDLVQNFTIDKSTTQTLTLKASWGNTITETDGTSTASAPEFVMSYSSN